MSMSIFGSPIWLMVLWLFAMGAAVGSFMNVVVYRLPLGMSLVHPPSHCPKCGKRIPWYDNVPIFGWIMLRGRCRQCHNPISACYPMVEAITATMFGLLAIVEIDRLDSTYPLHLLLLCTLLCAGLIEYDGNRPPLRLFVPALTLGLALHLVGWFWPSLKPPTSVGPNEVRAPYVEAIRVMSVLGIVAFAGTVLDIIRCSTWGLKKWDPIIFGVFCVNIILGAHSAPILGAAAVLYLLLQLLGRKCPRLRISPLMSLAIATFVWFPVWATFVSR